MEEKTRKLLLALEMLALLTAAVLILIDYKLKQDLVTLTRNVENAIEKARALADTNFDTVGNPSNLHSGTVVDNVAPMETRSDTSQASQNGKPATSVPLPRTNPKRNRGNRDSQVSRPDNQVGS